MAKHLVIDDLQSEFKCLATIMKCNQETPAKIDAAVARVREATASSDFWLLPSFEGLQLGKAILEYADSISQDRSETHKHLQAFEDIQQSVSDLDTMRTNKTLYKETNLKLLSKTYKKTLEVTPKMEGDHEKDLWLV